jgi:hypothetical protein
MAGNFEGRVASLCGFGLLKEDLLTYSGKGRSVAFAGDLLVHSRDGTQQATFDTRSGTTTSAMNMFAQLGNCQTSTFLGVAKATSTPSVLIMSTFAATTAEDFCAEEYSEFVYTTQPRAIVVMDSGALGNVSFCCPLTAAALTSRHTILILNPCYVVCVSRTRAHAHAGACPDGTSR